MSDVALLSDWRRRRDAAQAIRAAAERGDCEWCGAPLTDHELSARRARCTAPSIMTGDPWPIGGTSPSFSPAEVIEARMQQAPEQREHAEAVIRNA